MLCLMLATSNPGKVAELRAILASLFDLGGLSLLSPRDWPAPLPQVTETGTTFAENARLKADALAAATGIPSLADDSGLCVDALDGAPGLYSARWAGPGASDSERNTKLLLALADVPPERRTARFVCEGVILTAPRGANGFGYDPLFLLPDLRRTMAELTSEEKNRLSHRALAVSRLSSQFSVLMNPP